VGDFGLRPGLWRHDAPVGKTGRHVRAPAHVHPRQPHVRARFDTRRLVVDHRTADRHAGLARAGRGHAESGGHRANRLAVHRTRPSGRLRHQRPDCRGRRRPRLHAWRALRGVRQLAMGILREPTDLRPRSLGCVALRASDEGTRGAAAARLRGRRAKPRRLGPDHLCTHPGAVAGLVDREAAAGALRLGRTAPGLGRTAGLGPGMSAPGRLRPARTCPRAPSARAALRHGSSAMRVSAGAASWVCCGSSPSLR
jgi:hypothetical protein